jgi:hypothetical protein
MLHVKFGVKNPIFAGCRMPCRSTRRAKECDIQSFWQY